MASHSPAHTLRRLIADDRITESALHAITGIDRGTLTSYLGGPQSENVGLTTAPRAVSGDEGQRLAVLAAMLAEGLRSPDFPISDDERVTAIIESLTAQCHLTHQNIAQLTGIALADLERFISDPQSTPLEVKYQLAVRGSYIANAVTQAQPR